MVMSCPIFYHDVATPPGMGTNMCSYFSDDPEILIPNTVVFNPLPWFFMVRTVAWRLGDLVVRPGRARTARRGRILEFCMSLDQIPFA